MWPWIPEVCLKELSETRVRARLQLLSEVTAGCSQKNMCNTGNVRSYMLMTWPLKGSVCCSGCLSVDSAKIPSLPRNEWSEDLLGLTPLGLAARSKKRSLWVSVNWHSCLNMACPCPYLGLTGFWGQCWDCSGCAPAKAGNLGTPSFSADRCAGGEGGCLEWRLKLNLFFLGSRSRCWQPR